MLPEIIASNDGEMVKARMAFEEAARGMQLDLRLPSVSGRLHALFDLQVPRMKKLLHPIQKMRGELELSDSFSMEQFT